MTKKQSSHTPGPWVPDGPRMHADGKTITGFFIAHKDSGRIGEAFLNCLVRTDAEGEANARLIAAAPDMLEALQCLLPGLVLDLRYADDDDDKDALRSRIDTVTEALKKATGHE